MKGLEKLLGVVLFERLPRGLMLTQEGESLLPTLRDAFGRIAGSMHRFEGGRCREVLNGERSESPAAIIASTLRTASPLMTKLPFKVSASGRRSPNRHFEVSMTECTASDCRYEYP